MTVFGSKSDTKETRTCCKVLENNQGQAWKRYAFSSSRDRNDYWLLVIGL